MPVAQQDAAAIIAKARRVRALRCKLAREDPNVFMSFVLRDERTNKPIEQAPVHKRWQDILNVTPRAIFWAHVEAGKTSQIAVGRVLWELGRDPSIRIAIVSNTKDMAQKIVRLVGQYIQKSEELHAVFPNLLPTDDPALPWKAQSLTVRRKGVGGKDPSIQACGVHGNILGSRVDLAIFDDVLDHENTATPAPREDTYRWLRSTPMGRLTEGARVWVIGNAWHPDDAMHRFAKEPGFRSWRFPVLDEHSQSTWPSRWSLNRIESAKADLGPLEAARQLMCQSRDETSSRFKRDWIDVCLKRGDGFSLAGSLEEAWDGPLPDGMETALDGLLPPDWLANAHADLWAAGRGGFVFTGVDLGVQRKDSNDSTVLFTILVEPDGTRRPLHIQTGKWTGPDILVRIEETFRKFGSIFMVENNAAQHFMVQWAQESKLVIPVVPFTTGRNKAHPEFGVESMGAEMAAGKWKIPNRGGRVEPEVGEWITELLFYDPREHVGDRVMASWFAREAARRYVDHGGIGRRVVGVRSF